MSKSKKNSRKLLLLSVGYGKGHHSAAYALEEYYSSLGWEARVVDICELAQPFLFRVTQAFYAFCVRRAPWLWGITYSLTDTADWARLVHGPVMRPVMHYLHHLLLEEKPDLVICTYPLFAYMLDALKTQGVDCPPYVVLVTDAREISRPWMCSEAPLVIVPDAISREQMMQRYGLAAGRIVAAGFPVRRAFAPLGSRQAPDGSCLRVLYGAYRQYGGVVNDIRALLSTFPQLELTVIGGVQTRRLQRLFAAECHAGRLKVLRETSCMSALISESHLYIGKAGAATMFECYAAEVPMLVNFTLPGQEQGNLELLLDDGAGRHVESTAHLVDTVAMLLADGAELWHTMRHNIVIAGRGQGAAQIARVINTKLNV